MPHVSKGLLAGLLVILGMALAGCHHDRPHDYGTQRPEIDELDARDRGLQSKDVVAASDQMAQDLLALPELNASGHQWTIVVDRVENRTVSSNFDLGIFLERLRVNLSKYGRGRVTLIENLDRYRDIQSRELEGGRGDEFGQGSGGAGQASANVQPDYALYAKIVEMPNRGTSFYLCEFSLTNLRSRQQVWNNAYEVKVAR